VTRPEPGAVELERLRRLKAVDNLLPALFKVLDVRQIFDLISSMTKEVRFARRSRMCSCCTATPPR
jgi:hypothetical protein